MKRGPGLLHSGPCSLLTRQRWFYPQHLASALPALASHVLSSTFATALPALASGSSSGSATANDEVTKTAITIRAAATKTTTSLRLTVLPPFFFSRHKAD